tara:strand:- start:48 stop:197 length:150 start_codon:yes stop_codon:yes gene_type:complete
MLWECPVGSFCIDTTQGKRRGRGKDEYNIRIEGKKRKKADIKELRKRKR